MITNDSILCGVYIQPDTELLFFDLKVNYNFLTYMKNFLKECPYWGSTQNVFRTALGAIFPNCKSVDIIVRQNVNGIYQLRFDTKDLNTINNRKQYRYPDVPIQWNNKHLRVVIPVYFFTPKSDGK